MLIIGHRGSRGTKPENTIASLHEAMQVDADMIEFDVRLTRDGIPVLSHNMRLFGTRKRELALLRLYTLTELQKRTADSEFPLTTLDDAMRECYGKIYLNVEIKEVSAVGPTLNVIEKYVTDKRDWDNLLISSFKPLALLAVRRRAPHAALGMLHYRNPLAFIGWYRLLSLSAVGFHRLYVSMIAIEAAKRASLFTYVYTVNQAVAANKLAERGVDGIVTDFPAQLLEQFSLRDQ